MNKYKFKFKNKADKLTAILALRKLQYIERRKHVEQCINGGPVW